MKFAVKFIKAFAVAAALTAVTACGGGQSAQSDTIELKVGATPVPHAEILAIAKEMLAKENINLTIVEYTDYVQPNLALDTGEINANFFQHTPYLNDFNAENNTELVSAVSVHFETMALYPGKTASIDELPDGAVIAVPNDTTNEARALKLLESAGLITLPDGSGLSVTPRDIAENPKNLVFQEIEAALIPSVLADVDMGVINGNYALSAGLDTTGTLLAEGADSEAAQTFANILAVRPDDKGKPEIKSLVEAITSQEVAEFLEKEYAGTVIPVF